jgi:hypothetical protein
MLCHLTASCRFHGDMNVDMNEICTNLVVNIQYYLYSPIQTQTHIHTNIKEVIYYLT